MRYLLIVLCYVFVSTSVVRSAEPTTQPSASQNGVTITILDTYISDVKVARQEWHNDRPLVRWDNKKDHLCLLFLIQNNGEKPVRYVTWHGDLMNYKMANKGKGQTAEVNGIHPFTTYDWAVASSDISKQAWDKIFKTAAHTSWQKYSRNGKFTPEDEKAGIAYMQELIDKMFLFKPDGIEDMGFKTVLFFNHTLQPHMAVLDIGIFDMPLKDSDLQIRLSWENVGGDGVAEFTVKRGDIRYRTTDWAAARMAEQNGATNKSTEGKSGR